MRGIDLFTGSWSMSTIIDRSLKDFTRIYSTPTPPRLLVSINLAIHRANRPTSKTIRVKFGKRKDSRARARSGGFIDRKYKSTVSHIMRRSHACTNFNLFSTMREEFATPNTYRSHVLRIISSRRVVTNDLSSSTSHSKISEICFYSNRSGIEILLELFSLSGCLLFLQQFYTFPECEKLICNPRDEKFFFPKYTSISTEIYE